MKDILRHLAFLIYLACSLFSNSSMAQVWINEACSSNNSLIEDEDDDTRDWIELYNSGSETIQLTGYYLSDSKNDSSKWQFGSGSIAAGEYFIVFASGKDRPMVYPPHTNFKLSQSGEKIWLYNSDKILVDSMTVPFVSTDLSYGPHPDGNSPRAFFQVPTPGASNDASVPSDHIIAYAPVLSVRSGQFSEAFELTISSRETQGIIRYTLDGREPSASDPVYIAPLAVSETSVVNARTFVDGLIPSSVTIGNYLFSNDRTLPKVFLSTHPGYFFDTDTGIYVFGPNASPDFPYYGANFWSDTEIPVNVQWIDTYGRIGIDQKLGLQIHGGSISRTRPMRSLRLEADDKYGNDEIDFSLFSTKVQPKNKRFLLRNSGSDYLKTIFRDGFIHNTFILNNLHVDAVCYNPVEVYLNGEFWGIHNAREKLDRYYTKYNYGVHEDSVDILEEQDLVMEGSFARFDAMEALVLSLNLTEDQNFEVADSLFDLLNMADYYICQTYINNLDWPYNNLKFWRAHRLGAKWRYIIFDLDATLGGVDFAPVEFDALTRAFGSFGDDNRHIVLFRKLLENRSYFEYFINRYCDLTNTCFSPLQFSAAVDRAAARIRSVVPRHFERWGPDENNWEQEVEIVKQYVSERPPYALSYLQNFFELDAKAEISLNVFPPTAANLQLNSISVKDFPFEGVYFQDVPIRIDVTEHQGFKFSHWESNRPDLNPLSKEQNFLPQTGDELTAIFTGISNYTPLEVYPNPASEHISVRFVLPERQEVSIFLVDLSGQTKHQLFNGILAAGTHLQELSVPAGLQGVQLLTVLSNTTRYSQKVVLLKPE